MRVCLQGENTFGEWESSRGLSMVFVGEWSDVESYDESN